MFGSPDSQIERANELHTPPAKGQPYSVPLPGSAAEGRSAIYRHWRFTDKPLLDKLVPEISTPHEAFENSVAKWPKNRCLGHRPYDAASKTFGSYVWEDYETVAKRRKDFGAGLVHLHKQAGVTAPKYGIGLWCQNRPEWQITDLACMSQGLFTVSIYDTLGPDTTEYIINHSELSCVVAGMNHVTALLKLKPRLPTLKLIIVLDPLSAGELPGESKGDLLNSLASEQGVTIHYIRDVEALGEKQPIPMNPPTPDDIVTINYTSGTTGNPKGVVLTHSNAHAATCTSLVLMGSEPGDVICSFLPLAHIYQRLGEHSGLAAGAAIGYFHGNIVELVEDLQMLRPTIFSGVPRLYNRFGAKIKEATVQATGVKGALSRHVVSAKLAAINDKENPTNKHMVYDRIWAKKVSAGLGLDRCKVLVSGSAPIDPSLHQFLRVVFGSNFTQGYGLTETYAVALVQHEGDFSAGNCGGVGPNSECALVDVPDMEYLSTDKPHPRGELVIRSTSQFREYFRNDEETAKAVDADGWFHTGDVCSVDELGRFKVIDRRKNVLKLAQGEYISPERIENVYLANCSYLAAGYVHGDSHQSFLVAIFGVAPDLFPQFASKVLGEDIAVGDVEKLKEACNNKKVQQAVLKELDKVGRKNKFNSYERVRAVRLFVEPFSIENQLLTPTLKLKRPQTCPFLRRFFVCVLGAKQQTGRSLPTFLPSPPQPLAAPSQSLTRDPSPFAWPSHWTSDKQAARMPVTRATALAMSEDMDDATHPRASRFKEHTNTNGSIRPPPEELWKDIGIDNLIEQFNEENAKPPVSRKSSANHAPRVAKPVLSRAASGSATLTAASANSASAPNEGTYARLQRAFASVFGSVLGKRKAGAMEAEREREQQQQQQQHLHHQQLLDERKKAAEIAYHEAKDLGLLPTPKIFVRPGMAARTPVQPAEKMQLGLTAALAEAATPVRTPGTPRTPGLRHTPSRKDLHKQKKLTKRVSDLEFKLASARKELHTVLYNDLPPVRPVPKFAPPTPDRTQSENEFASPSSAVDADDILMSDASVATTTTPRKSIGKIVKKRKAATHDSDAEYKPIPTDSEADLDLLSGQSEVSEPENNVPERSIKRVKSSVVHKTSKSKRASSRLHKKFSRGSLKGAQDEKPITVVPDGAGVPDVPSIPKELEGKGVRVTVKERDDGYGGWGHEIF
ncbi:long-chain-fatty-acid-CoA ligase 1 [Stemphylium lycopersici]|uniref:Long-chain-fatty-acid-CoA ligase 1 n=1 Tax=Stemphylium lycopersici TaxID=183478 RepID=A0A364N7G3_STELY|nr:acetyl-CoA synthetase-like protein [Stemphylium lycopersici]RAR02350.1 long-chain-fatty-acid-CoA ligase 1 [Stemphylium lycopersici]RAR13177.1 long-chain-fatty-acid-CoA ligase 1 [Stemphylium lycopersici]